MRVQYKRLSAKYLQYFSINMGDSDEEYERRRRDKFRRERNDYTERREERRGRTDQWEDRYKHESLYNSNHKKMCMKNLKKKF